MEGGTKGGREWEQRDRREEKWKEGGELPVKTASVATLVTSIYIMCRN